MSIAIVMGSGGLIGSEASRYFVDKGLEVVGIDNDMRAVFFLELTQAQIGTAVV